MPPFVLVVEDEDSVRQLLELTLQMVGFETEGAPDGATALEIVARRLPDVVTLDIMMPGMDGWEVLRRLNADPRTSWVPVVVVSGMGTQQLEAAPEHGLATAVLGKPLDLAAFADVVRATMRTPRLPTQALAPESESASSQLTAGR